ncbi:transglutaminase domain-containing protein [Devosia albogilva]|uniref:Transglutaminase domain-containing protein n=1 Tax=Devosia albogilva TaxID=429726 RepID=A0ABW5QNW3_9HYPH
MLLSISHTSTYRYDRPVNYAVQRLRLWPRSSSVQTVEDWKVEVVGATSELFYDDAFANRTELLRSEPDTSEIVIHASGQVTTKDTAGVFGRGIGVAPLWVFLRQTPLTAAGEAVKALVQPLAGMSDTLDQLHRLSRDTGERVAYVPGSTDVATPAEAALVNGSGVCQDHAHIFIAAARLLGVPARYVSGYLLMEGQSEQTATHAWAEAYVEDLGWVGFDAANGVAPDEKYVRIACGLDYSQSAPITGLRSGSSAESLAVALNVEQ